LNHIEEAKIRNRCVVLTKMAEMFIKDDLVDRIFLVADKMCKKKFGADEFTAFACAVLRNVKEKTHAGLASRLVEEFLPDGMRGERVEAIFMEQLKMHSRVDNNKGVESCARKWKKYADKGLVKPLGGLN